MLPGTMSALSQNDLLFVLGAAGLLIIVLIAGLVVYRRRAARTPARRLRAAAADCLSGFLIPNGDEGEIVVEYALLTHGGIVIVDVKDVAGNIFGSDAMQDWTVISEKRRFTFANPQYALYDRLAAIKRLVKDVPVTGHVVFTSRGHFSKGQPTDVMALDALIERLEGEREEGDEDRLRAWLPQWDALRETIVTTQVDHLMKR